MGLGYFLALGVFCLVGAVLTGLLVAIFMEQRRVRQERARAQRLDQALMRQLDEARERLARAEGRVILLTRELELALGGQDSRFEKARREFTARFHATGKDGGLEATLREAVWREFAEVLDKIGKQEPGQG